MEKKKKFLSLFICFIVITSITTIGTSVKAEAKSNSKRAKTISKICKKTWILDEMYEDGKETSPGSSAGTYGAYIKFKKNKKYICNIGLSYYATGKYTVSKKGKITLNVKEQGYGAGNLKIKDPKIKVSVTKKLKKLSFKVHHKRSIMKFVFIQI